MSWTRVNLPFLDETFVRCLSHSCHGGPVGVFSDDPTSPRSIKERLRMGRGPGPMSFFLRDPVDGRMTCLYDPGVIPFECAKDTKRVYFAHEFPWFSIECGAHVLMYMTWKSMDVFQKACSMAKDEADVQRVMEV